ncbi:hypothetical protein NL676_008969 [Syzygium grande]|nr:hypothetical protein NL676_008969 [Syzygium grande]
MVKTKEEMKKRNAGTTPEQPPPGPDWVDLPREVTAAIISRLGAAETLETAQNVCASWRSICRDPSMWRAVDISVPWYLPAMGCGLDVACRRAVDLSRGGCVDISIEYFGTDELLKYITDRCNHIRRLDLYFAGAFQMKVYLKQSKGFLCWRILKYGSHMTISRRMPWSLLDNVVLF